MLERVEKIIDVEVEKKLNDINWSLGWFDFASDVIVSNLTTLKEEFPKIDPARGEVFSEFNDIIQFKSLGLYSILMKIEETVLGTTLAFYKKYHGPFREEVGGGALADVERNLIYSFESFLTQYKSLLDISIKFAFSLCSVGKGSLKQVDSFEKLMKTIKGKEEPYYTIINSSGLFSDFIAETKELQDIKNYRDYIIHHAYLNPEKSSEGIGGHQFFKYWLPMLTQSKRKYTTDPKSLIRLDYFCRKKLYILFKIIEKLTDNLFTDEIKKSHIESLKKENPEFIKQILSRIAKKEMSADRIMHEDELRAFLSQRGIDFGEFVEESRWSERQMEGMKSYNGKDMSYLLEKVFYKPVGNIKIFKTHHIYDRDWKPPIEDKPTYGTVVTGVSVEDFISGSPDIARILTHLKGCGLVYVSNFQGATRYASVREDLKALILNLSELTQFRWSLIQNPEMNYFRHRTTEETENTRRILGKDADEFLKKEDRERERIQEEYREWKKQPKHYHDRPVAVMRDNQVVQRIFHREFEAEMQQGFVNWKSNKIIHLHTEKDGFINRVETRFVPDEMFSDEKVSEIITKCQEAWKEAPKHFLDIEREFIEESKKRYDENVKGVKKNFADIIKNYDYLELVFKSINEDVFRHSH